MGEKAILFHLCKRKRPHIPSTRHFLMTRKDISRKDRHTQLLVNHQPQNPHLRRPSVIQFDRPLPQLGRVIKLVPTEVQRSVAVIPHELGLVVEPVGVAVDDLGDDEEGAHLGEDGLSVVGGGEGGPGSEAGGDVGGEVGEAVAGGGGEVSYHGEHGDAAVLELDLTKAVESLLVGIREHSHGVEESQRSLSTKLILEGANLGVDASLLSGSEGSGRADKGKEAGSLHHGF
mmetsp:Transcript_7029/g.9286  ORF Transcript_7029/g.9286 Transcript_7029/m.9286 type:complete len:231 (-) Transcript_7029:26-718(-)